MTTSYKTSLRLKEFGVEQKDGLFYWVNVGATDSIIPTLRLNSNIVFEENILCRAFTLGELVRELPEFTSILKLNDRFTIGGASYTTFIHNTSPEEAAGELWAELLKQEKLKA